MAVRIFASGDTCPMFNAAPILSGALSETWDEGLLAAIDRADIALTNLESPLTTSREPYTRVGTHLKTDPKFADFLRKTGFDLVTLANNHIFDYGLEGLQDTLHACKQAGLATVGAGETLASSNHTYHATINGERLSIINVAENERSAATTAHGGAHPLDVVQNSRIIRRCKEDAEHVIVIVHGGNEFTAYPSVRVVERYRFFVEQGADAVIAHHPHCVQGFEVYRGCPIFYSLGNFLFPPRKRMGASWHQGFAVSLTLPFTSLDDMELIPYEQSCGSPSLRVLRGEDRTDFLARLQSLSDALSDLATLDSRWSDSLRSQADALLWYLSYGSKPMQAIRSVLSRMGLLSGLVRRRNRRMRVRLQIIRTEAHRDLLIHTMREVLGDE